MTESPRAAVLSNDQVADILSKPYRDQWTLVRTVEAAVLAQARAVDAGSEPLPDYQLNAIALEVLSTLGPVARLPPGWIETARAIEIAVRRALTTPAVDVPDCDTCAHAALKESQEPCSSCVPYAPARPMWTPKATAPAAAGAAPQAMPAEAQPCDQCGLIVPWCRRRDCRRFDAYTKMKRMRDLVALEDQCGGVFAAGALAATQPAGETQGADDVRVLLRECANMLEAKERERDLPKRERYVGNSAHYVTALVTRARAALARPAAGAGEGLTDTQRLDTLESEREVAGWLESSGWLIDAIGIPDCRGKTLREAIDAVHAARSTRTAQGGQE